MRDLLVVATALRATAATARMRSGPGDGPTRKISSLHFPRGGVRGAARSARKAIAEPVVDMLYGAVFCVVAHLTDLEARLAFHERFLRPNRFAPDDFVSFGDDAAGVRSARAVESSYFLLENSMKDRQF